MLENDEIRAVADNRNETIGKKIREAELQKYPFLLIVGEEEEKNGTVSVRRQGQSGKDNQTMKIDEFVAFIQNEIRKTEKSF